MKILYIYRSPQMGFSIGNVFKPIEKEMMKKCQCDSITFEKPNYNFKTLVENIIIVRKYMRKNKDAIIHITGTENYLLPFLTKYKTVVTVHDLGFYTRNKKTIRLKLKYPLWIGSLKLANKVIFISEKTKLEAEKLVKLKKNKISVIMNPISEQFKNIKHKEYNVKKPIILQIGTYENKNLERVIEAIKDISCHLRIVGKLNSNQINLLNKNSIEYSQVENITNEQIIKEYQNCDIVSFPSIYEGFGMPIIEGQASGKVIVTSNISPMKEIARDSCCLVDPLDINEIRKGFMEAINNYKKYKKLSIENVKRFSLDIKVEKYFNVYKEC